MRVKKTIFPGGSRSAVWLLPLLLAACDQDAAEIVGDINAAREGCTQEALKAGDEECVRMFESYAEMGTEAIETYIGAIQALDQALERMPPAQFDTAGLGHAVTPSVLSREPDSSPGPSGYSPGPSPSAYGDPYYRERSAQPRGWGTAPDGGYERGGWSDPRTRDPYADDRYYPEDPYDDRYSDERYRSGPYNERGYGDGRYPGGEYYDAPYRGDADGRTGEYGGGRWDDPRYRQATPPPGALLPPDQRLSRPWLRDQGAPRYDTQQRWRVLPRRGDPRADPDSLPRGESPYGRSPRRRQ